MHLSTLSRYFIWGTNDNLLSKITSRNLYSLTTGMAKPFNASAGSGCSFFRLQQCIHPVFDLENLNPLLSAHFCIICKHCCSCLSIVFMCLDWYHIKKSITYREQSIPWPRHFTILYIFILNNVTANMLL